MWIREGSEIPQKIENFLVIIVNLGKFRFTASLQNSDFTKTSSSETEFIASKYSALEMKCHKSGLPTQATVIISENLQKKIAKFIEYIIFNAIADWQRQRFNSIPRLVTFCSQRWSWLRIAAVIEAMFQPPVLDLS